MPAVLLVPVRFPQTTSCSRSVTEPAPLQQRLPCTAAMRRLLSRAGEALSPAAPPASRCPCTEPSPALGGCWPPECYQRHLPTCQLTENPLLPFVPAPSLTQQTVTPTHGAQQKYPIGCCWHTSVRIHRFRSICPSLLSLFLKTSRGAPQPAERPCISPPLYLLSFPNSEVQHFFLAN